MPVVKVKEIKGVPKWKKAKDARLKKRIRANAKKRQGNPSSARQLT